MTTPDPQALFAEGASRGAAGRDLVEQAANFGHPPAFIWLAADAVVQRRDTAEALTWLRRIRPEDAPDGLVIRPSSFHPTFGEEFDDGWGELDPTYLVVSAEPRAAARALSRAAVRLLGVTHSGVELADSAADEYTPNHVSSPRLDVDGASIYVDCKGETSEAMADTMVDIVVEEMSRAKVVGVLAVPGDAFTRPPGEGGDLPAPDGFDPDAPGGQAWAMTRMLFDAGAVVREYRTADGSWTRDARAADCRDVTTDDPWDALSDADLADGWALQEAPSTADLPPAWMLVTL